VEYFNYLGGMITDGAKCTRKFKCTVAMPKGAFNEDTLFTSKMDLNFRKKLVKCYMWSILRKVDQKYLDTFEV
jgi:hypothetical protein